MEITGIIRIELGCCFCGFLPHMFWSQGNILVPKRWPFRKHLIAIGCFIHCDIYENFMDSSRSSLWHFGFPLKLWIWRFFHLMGHGALNENNSSHTESCWRRWKGDERKESDIVFMLYEKPINMVHLDRDDYLVWFESLFPRLLHSAGYWNREIINGCSNSGEEAPWRVIRLGSCLM